MSDRQFIGVRGAREENLKDIALNIPIVRELARLGCYNGSFIHNIRQAVGSG